jgi:hypothetical protein
MDACGGEINYLQVKVNIIIIRVIYVVVIN